MQTSLSASLLLHLPTSASYLSAIIMLLARVVNEDQLYLSIRPWEYLLIFRLTTVSAKSGSWQLRFFVITDATRSNLFAFVDAYMHPSRASREFTHRGLVSVRRSRTPWTSAVRYNIGRKRKTKINDLSIFRSLFLAPRIQLILSMCNTSQYSLGHFSPFFYFFF